MANPTDLVFKCFNPECQKNIQLTRPQKTGVYNVTCPFCKETKQIKFKGTEEMEEEQSASKPDFSNASPIQLPDDFFLNEAYRFMCPHCAQQEIGFKSDKEGKKEFQCPTCNGRIILLVREKTKHVKLAKGAQKGRIVVLKRFSSKKYPLKEGSHFIGREDQAYPSEISIKGDATVSRRSVRIDVKKTETGYFYKMTVLKATNPVFHNNDTLGQNDSISLNFGDTIIVGRTRLRFEKDM